VAGGDASGSGVSDGPTDTPCRADLAILALDEPMPTAQVGPPDPVPGFTAWAMAEDDVAVAPHTPTYTAPTAASTPSAHFLDGAAAAGPGSRRPRSCRRARPGR
jgi:hypothetical protein